MFSFQCHWCIHSLPHSLIHPFHSFLTESPSKKLSHETRNKTKSRRPRSPTQTEGLRTVWCGLVPQGTYNGTKIYFQDPGLITIFLLSNRNLNQQTLIQCSRFVIRVRAHKNTPTKDNCLGWLDNPKNTRRQVCQCYSTDWYRLISV